MQILFIFKTIMQIFICFGFYRIISNVIEHIQKNRDSTYEPKKYKTFGTIIFIVIGVVGLNIVNGCSNIVEFLNADMHINADTFVDYMLEENYDVFDLSAMYSVSELADYGVENIFSAVTSDNSHQVTLYDCFDNDTAKTMYADLIDAEELNDKTSINLGVVDITVSAIDEDNTRYVFVRCFDSVYTIQGYEAYKDEFRDIAKKIATNTEYIQVSADSESISSIEADSDTKPNGIKL